MKKGRRKGRRKGRIKNTQRQLMHEKVEASMLRFRSQADLWRGDDDESDVHVFAMVVL